MQRPILRLLVLAALAGGVVYWIRTQETADSASVVRSQPGPTPAVAPRPPRPPVPPATAPAPREPGPGARRPLSRPGVAGPARGTPALPPGYEELLPHPQGVVAREVRPLPDGGYWVELIWEGAAVADVAEAYRGGLSEKGWRVLTPSTARHFATSFARRGLASEIEAEAVVVGQGHGRAAAVLLMPDTAGHATRIEVSLLAERPRRP